MLQKKILTDVDIVSAIDLAVVNNFAGCKKDLGWL